MKALVILAISLNLTACGLLNLDEFKIGIREEKDIITEETKYISTKIEELNTTRTPSFSSLSGGSFLVYNAIKLNPYYIKNNESKFIPYLEVTVYGKNDPFTNEIQIKCKEKKYLSHKLTKDEMNAIRSETFPHTFSKSNTIYYQEEIITTQVTPEVFNYLETCIGDIILRAKGVKHSMESSIMMNNGDGGKFISGLKDLSEINLPTSKR
jgi:hypothetical protein